MHVSDNRHCYELYEGKERLIDEVPRCGLVEFARGTRQAFGDRRGSDPSSFEFYFVLRGVLCMQIDGRQVDAMAGQALIVRPGQEAVGGGSGFAVDPCRVCWMVLRPPGGMGKRKSELSDFLKDLARIERASFPVSPDILHHCNRLVAEHELRDRRSAVIVRALAILIAAGIVRDYQRLLAEDEGKSNWASARIGALLTRIEANSDYDVSIDEMAARCRLSHSYFCRIFAQTFGSAPGEHLARLRIKKARTLLAETGRSVTDIAMELGFSSSQYFATVFRKFSDYTPSAYRRNASGRNKG